MWSLVVAVIAISMWLFSLRKHNHFHEDPEPHPFNGWEDDHH